MSAFDPHAGAATLDAAWRSGAQLGALPQAQRPSTMADGYALQDALIAAQREAPHGWKLGVGSPAAMRASGLGRPLVGRLLSSRCHPNGSTITLPDDAPVTLEFEIAFVLGRDIEPAEQLASPLAAIGAVRTTFEFVRSRFVDRVVVGWPSFAGDNVGFEALVIGEEVAFDRIEAITRGVVVTLDGTETAQGLDGDALTDPLASIAALLVHARERGVTLKRGELVTTGAAAKPFDFRGDAELVARFPGGQTSARVRRR